MSNSEIGARVAYYALDSQLTIDDLRRRLESSQLDGVWASVEQLQRADGRSLLRLALTDLRSGDPLHAEAVGALLADGRGVLLTIVDEEGKLAQLQLMRDESSDGELPAAFESNGDEDTQQAVLEATFGELVGIDWRLASAPSERPTTTELLLRGRRLTVPPELARQPQLFSFHTIDAADDAPGDHLALVLLDQRILDALWMETPAGSVVEFLEAISPMRGRVLGPLTSALDEVRERLLISVDEPPGRHPSPDPLSYELLAMASCIGYMPGAPVALYDERFLPLFELSEVVPSTEVLGASLDEIEPLGVLSAMAEVLPYSVPEGQLLDCFGDEELSPLAPWAVEEDGSYEGSLFLLDQQRLSSSIRGFDQAAFDARVAAFAEAWHRALGSQQPFDVWQAARAEIDGAELERHDRLRFELDWLLRFAAATELQPALLFYTPTPAVGGNDEDR